MEMQTVPASNALMMMMDVNTKHLRENSDKSTGKKSDAFGYLVYLI